MTFRTFRYDKLSAMISGNGSRTVVAIFVRMITATVGVLTPQLITDTYILVGSFRSIARKQGIVGLVKYLKVCFVITQQVLGGQYIADLGSIGPRVSRTNSGLPRILPARLRARLLDNPKIIQYVLTLFGFYRDLECPGLLKTKTITGPYTGSAKAINHFQPWIAIFCTTLKYNLGTVNPVDAFVQVRTDHSGFPNYFDIIRQTIRKIGGLRTFDMFSGFPIQKSSPHTIASNQEIATNPLAMYRALKDLSNGQVTSLVTLARMSPLGIYGKMLIRALTSTSFNRGDLPSPGKLGLKLEPAGKVRVFAMVDPFTQWVMRPLHNRIFDLLRVLPMDGTFNQHAPLKRAWKLNSTGGNSFPLYSMDLSAATDRLPLFLQIPLIKTLFNMSDQEILAWSDLLVGRPYIIHNVPEGVNIPKGYTVGEDLYYAVGQPMGALSSWAMLALTHHFIVQVAAWQLGIGIRSNGQHSLFTDYAILGDDIVIYHSKVAKRYHYLIQDILGVDCNLAKSLLSPKGKVLEFAKRTQILGYDVSLLSIKELHVALESPLNLGQYMLKHNLSLVQSVKLAGYGYKVVGSIHTKSLDSFNCKIKLLIMSLLAIDLEGTLRAFSGYKGLLKSLTPKILRTFLFEMFDQFSISYEKRYLAKVQSFLSPSNWIYEAFLSRLVIYKYTKSEHLQYITACKRKDITADQFDHIVKSIPKTKPVQLVDDSALESLSDLMQVAYDNYFISQDKILRDVIPYFRKAAESFVNRPSSVFITKQYKEALDKLQEASALSELSNTSSFIRVDRGDQFNSPKIHNLMLELRRLINRLRLADQAARKAKVLLNTKCMQSSFNPLLLLRPLIGVASRTVTRRVILNKIGFIPSIMIKSMIQRALTRSILITTISVFGTLLSTLLFGIGATVSGITFICTAITSMLHWTSEITSISMFSDICGIIERLSLILLFIIGIICWTQWSTFSTAVIILLEEVQDGTIGYLDGFVRLINLGYTISQSLINEYLHVGLDTLSSLSPISQFTTGMIGTYIFYWILRWILGW